MQISFYTRSEINTRAQGLRGGPTLTEAPSVRLTPFELCSCVSRIRCRYGGEWVSERWCAFTLVTLLEASGHSIAKRSTTKITGTTTQKIYVVLVAIPFVPFLWVLKTPVPVSPQDLFREAECSGTFQVKNALCLAMPTNILTFPQWEKICTRVRRISQPLTGWNKWGKGR